MTGYTVHTGTSKKFIEGWDRVFSGGKGDSVESGAPEKTAAQPKEAASTKKKAAGKAAPVRGKVGKTAKAAKKGGSQDASKVSRKPRSEIPSARGNRRINGGGFDRE